MREYINSFESMERIVNKYNTWDKITRSYGTDVKLSKTEIHTINIIGKNKDINLTKLANIQGITKGAVSQMINRLIKKGLLTKSVSQESEAQIRFNLTEKGIVAFKSHKKMHVETHTDFFNTLKNMSDSEYDIMINMLNSFEEFLDEIIENSTEDN
ncbi:MAG: MarR family transcriptional regulator [Clostridium sp.]|jgi:DNA-binding MarR family transcriptional regulator|nr:MarR family transcriptional regulator [Clostridium sp.]MCR4944735.1 MarR family transcriptional regulator [Clostridium sp.]